MILSQLEFFRLTMKISQPMRSGRARRVRWLLGLIAAPRAFCSQNLLIYPIGFGLVGRFNGRQIWA
jgi:hypothetical protein